MNKRLSQATRDAFDAAKTKVRDWTIDAFDIFHDVQHDYGAPPIGANTNGVTLPEYYDLFFGAPDGVADGETWSAMVFTAPVATRTVVKQGFTSDGMMLFEVAALDSEVLQPVNVVRCKTGGAFLTHITSAGQVDAYEPLNRVGVMPDNRASKLDQGPYVLSACGFELINTSPVIDVGGLITVGRYDGNNTSEQGWLMQTDDLGPTDTRPFVPNGMYAQPGISYNWCNSAPPDARHVAQYPGVVSWEMQRGAYVPAPINFDQLSWQRGCSDCLFYSQPLTDAPVGYSTSGSVRRASMGYLTPLAITYPTYTSGSNQPRIFCGNTSDWDSASKLVWGNLSKLYAAPSLGGCFAVLENIPKNNTFKLRVRIQYVIQPGRESSYFSLARALPSYDPKILELYSAALREIPPGTGQDENPNGEWWETVLGGIKKALPVIAGAGEFLLPELAPFIDPAQRFISGAIDRKLLKQQAAAAKAPKPRTYTDAQLGQIYKRGTSAGAAQAVVNRATKRPAGGKKGKQKKQTKATGDQAALAAVYADFEKMQRDLAAVSLHLG